MSDVDAVWPGGADGADDGVEGWDLPFDGGLREAYDLMNDENFAGLETHEEMLSDRVRVEAYHRGIHRHVAKGDVVVDLGTGTGLLAFMASRAGAKTVYAVEHSDFIDLAREIAEYNGFTNIEFIRANSREFTPPEPIDVVLHEQMGDELFNENMLENVLDLEACVDDDTTLSTSPLEPVTSWGNRVFRLDQQIARGEALRLDVRLGDLVEPSTWSVRAL